MTGAAIRESAIHCEARKIAYRQTKDGHVISFLLHPDEVPDELATAQLGSRWMLVVVEIGDDEQPVKKGGDADSTVDTDNHQRRNNAAPALAPEQPARAPRPFTSLPLTTQASIFCGEPVFWSFLNEEFEYGCGNAKEAAEAIRDMCEVASRRDLKSDNDGGRKFIELREQYLAWKLVAA